MSHPEENMKKKNIGSSYPMEVVPFRGHFRSNHIYTHIYAYQTNTANGIIENRKS